MYFMYFINFFHSMNITKNIQKVRKFMAYFDLFGKLAHITSQENRNTLKMHWKWDKCLSHHPITTKKYGFLQ